jgi:hypothetical protein
MECISRWSSSVQVLIGGPYSGRKPKKRSAVSAGGLCSIASRSAIVVCKPLGDPSMRKP